MLVPNTLHLLGPGLLTSYLQQAISDEDEDAANAALDWFGYAEAYNGNGSNGSRGSAVESVAVEESFEEDRISEHKEIPS